MTDSVPVSELRALLEHAKLSLFARQDLELKLPRYAPALLAAYEERERLKEDVMWRSEVLSMIVARLELHGCCHEGKSCDSTPPMCYDDWITCVVAKREREIKRLREERDQAQQRQELAEFAGDCAGQTISNAWEERYMEALGLLAEAEVFVPHDCTDPSVLGERIKALRASAAGGEETKT